MHQCNAVLHAENALCSCLADKIEEAQKELKDPKGSQKGKRCFRVALHEINDFCLFYNGESAWIISFSAAGCFQGVS